MVANINSGSNLYGALSYNQEKVDERLGKVLGVNLVFEPADGKPENHPEEESPLPRCKKKKKRRYGRQI